MNQEPIKSLHIENFKAFKSFDLPDVRKINLIGGMNNAGKSSLLEAVAILCATGTFMHSLASIRTTTIDGIISPSEAQTPGPLSDKANESTNRSMAWLTSMWSGFPDFSEKQNECLLFEDQTIKVTLQRGYLKNVKDPESFTPLNDGTLTLTEAEEAYRIEGYNSDNSNFISLSVQCASVPQPVVLGVLPYMRRLNFYRSSLRELMNLSKLWDQVALTPSQQRVVEILRTIDPTLDQISFIQDKKGYRNPYFTKRGDTKRYPLALMGDGINNVLAIALGLCSLPPHGVFLLDEVENGLHYSVQENVWIAILRYVKEYDIQVFATTHSNDTLYALARAAGEEGMEEDCHFIRLEQTDEGITPYTASVNAMLSSKDPDIELR